jgi:putative ABC transport system permease protein
VLSYLIKGEYNVNTIKTVIKRWKITPVNTSVLIFGLSVSILMISFGISFIAGLQDLQNDKLDHAPPNALMFNMLLNMDESESTFSLNNMKELLSGLDSSTGLFLNNMLLSISVDKYCDVSAEWYKKETGWHYPLLEGRYYSITEVTDGAKVALVGIELKKDTFRENNNVYINISGEKYRVVGIIGFKGKPSMWDSRLFMPLLSLPKSAKDNISNGSFSGVIYDSTGNTDVKLQRLLSLTKKSYPKADVSGVSELGVMDVISHVASNTDMLFVIGFLSYIVSLIYAVNTISFWIEERRHEIGIRKAFGYSNMQIISLIFKEMLCIAAISFVVALIAQIIISSFADKMFKYSMGLKLENILGGVVIILITAILTSVWPVAKSLKVQPVEAMKH